MLIDRHALRRMRHIHITNASSPTTLLAARQLDRGEKAAASLRHEAGRPSSHSVDARDESQCAALIEDTVRAHKKLDGLVNNAAWFPPATLEQTPTDLW